MSRRVINEKRAASTHKEWIEPRPSLPQAQAAETPQEAIIRLTLENDRLHAKVRDLELRLEQAKAAAPIVVDPKTVEAFAPLLQLMRLASIPDAAVMVDPVYTSSAALSPSPEATRKSKGRATPSQE